MQFRHYPRDTKLPWTKSPHSISPNRISLKYADLLWDKILAK